MAAATLEQVSDNAIWTGADLADGKGWLFALSQAEIADLKAMADAVRPQLKGDPNYLISMDKSHFDLGAFGATLDAVYNELKSGLGIALVRGLPIYSDDITYNGLYGLLPRQYLASNFIERVQVFRGANTFLKGAAPGGSGLGGAVNVVPKRAPMIENESFQQFL